MRGLMLTVMMSCLVAVGYVFFKGLDQAYEFFGPGLNLSGGQALTASFAGAGGAFVLWLGFGHVALIGENEHRSIGPNNAGWDRRLSAMIDRILAPAGIGNEEAIMNAPYSLADGSSIDTAESHSHLSVGEIPDSGHRLRFVESRS